MLIPGKTTMSSRGTRRSDVIGVSTPYVLTNWKLV
jgi:hypothetical protein